MATLLVQDDNGLVEDANTYIDRGYFTSYCDRQGYDVSGYEDDDIDAAIAEARLYMDYRWNWIGERQQNEQDTEFPRDNAFDKDDYLITGIPKKLKKIQCEYTYVRLVQGSPLNPTPDRDSTGARVIQISESVGPISEAKTFASGAAIELPVYPVPDNMVVRSGLVAQSNRVIRG